MVRQPSSGRYAIWIAALAMTAAGALPASTQTGSDPNSPPNPYRTVENWAQLPDGRKWGQTISVDIDRDGRSIWVVERCGSNSCAGSNLAPVLKFDSAGKFVASFGAGMLVFPHGSTSIGTGMSGSPMRAAARERVTRSSSSARMAGYCLHSAGPEAPATAPTLSIAPPTCWSPPTAIFSSETAMATNRMPAS